MTHSRYILHIALHLFIIVQSYAQSLVLNEVMADNETVLMDSDGEFADWIEVYNYGTLALDLEGYHLSDDEDKVDKWTFPKVILPPKSYLLVFASGKNKFDGQYLHTNFKISKEGEVLILSDSQGKIIESLEKVMLQEDESYGKLPSGGTINVKLGVASPGSSNDLENVLLFSHVPGLYSSPFHLEITSLLNDSVFFTTDGSEPTINSTPYANPIFLKNNSSSPNIWCEITTSPPQDLINNHAWRSPDKLVDKANVLRIASFNDGQKSSKTYTFTYLIHEDVHEKYDLPIISLVTEGHHLFDDETGIYVPGNLYDPENPVWTGNYFTDERESERPVHIELFNTNGELQLSQNAGIRIHGGKTRHAAQKSLKLYARKEYGKKFFNYPLMPQNGVDKYKRFILQTTMAAWGGQSVIKDVFAHEIVRELNFEKMDYQPSVVFINGEYWGIHHIRDRIDEEYLSYTSGLDLDSLEIDRIGNGHFHALTDYFKENVPIDNEDLEYISTQMDMDAFIDYNIAEMYLRNYDWPANNSMHWRPKKPDGKWRWIFFDIDGGFYDPFYNMFEHNTNTDETIKWPNDPKATFYFRSLIENEQFREMFLSRYKYLIENDFRTSNVLIKLDEIIERYRHEMPSHIGRWHFPRNYNGWIEDIENDLVNFVEERPCAVVQNIKDFFDLDDFQVNCEDPPQETMDHREELNIAVGPNPCTRDLSIINNSIHQRNLKIELYNALGQIVFNTQLSVKPDERIQPFKEHFFSGIYFMRLQHEELTSQITLFFTAY